MEILVEIFVNFEEIVGNFSEFFLILRNFSKLQVISSEFEEILLNLIINFTNITMMIINSAHPVRVAEPGIRPIGAAGVKRYWARVMFDPMYSVCGSISMALSGKLLLMCL